MPLKIYYLDDETDILTMFVDTFSGPDRKITTFSDPEKAILAIEALIESYARFLKTK